MNNYRKHKAGKSALVLAGGGLTGAVYHIGALRAIDDLLVNRTVNDFDIYVGTSAGALIGSMLASGLSPELMYKAVDGSRDEIPPIERKDIFTFANRDILSWGVRIPKKGLDVLYRYFSEGRDMTMFDVIVEMSESVPTGMYDGLALERYVQRVFKDRNLGNRFEYLDKELYIIATGLDDGERKVFGDSPASDPPISLAVAASSALPLVYKPVRINGKEYVDGGLRGTASLDLAIERGASLVVCINPLVPFDNTGRDPLNLKEKESGYISDKGIRLIADQMLRIISYSGLQYHIKQISRRHPEVDVILIEPRSDDMQMFYHNIMRYSARLTVARHGFESVTLHLAEDYQRYRDTLARHGIPISRRIVIEELAEIQQSGYDPEVIRKVLDGRSAACASRRKDTPICNLSRLLAELEMLVDNQASGLA
jgi:NTE family protein